MSLTVPIEFVGQRSSATISAQLQIAATWVWPEKTVVQWETQISDFEDQIEASLIAEAVMEGARGVLGEAMSGLHSLTSQDLNLLKNTYRNNEGKYEVVNGLVALGGSRGAIILEAMELEAAWLGINPLWVPLPLQTLGDFTTLREAAQAKLKEYLNKKAAWRDAVGAMNELAIALNEACVGWYAAATVVFPEGTAEGDMIRGTIPTTTDFTPLPGQAFVVLDSTEPGGYSVNLEAEHATKFDVFQKGPGDTDYIKIGTDVPPGLFVKTGLVAGEYLLKAEGRNSRGAGPESGVTGLVVP